MASFACVIPTIFPTSKEKCVMVWNGKEKSNYDAAKNQLGNEKSRGELLAECWLLRFEDRKQSPYSQDFLDLKYLFECHNLSGTKASLVELGSRQ